METEVTSTRKERDAGKTRRLLLDSARRRFAYDGYASTTVRDIAADAGVNVALINRYFTSKEGLFDACLDMAVEGLEHPTPDNPTFEQMLDSLMTRVADAPRGEHPLELLILIRSSGDTQADAIRLATLKRYSERMARIAGWDPGDPETGHLVLRAQIAIATAFGVVLLRASTALEPLVSATSAQLSPPLTDAVTAILRPQAGNI